MSLPRPPALRPEHCSICGEYPGVGAFCSECGVLMSHPTSADVAAPYLRRLVGELLDLLLFVLLPVWLYWMWRTSGDGQSPGKSLLNLYVIQESGQPLTPQRMWVRELVIKRLALGLIGYAVTLLGPIGNAGWVLLNPDRQCVHDRLVGTLVVMRREAPQPTQAVTSLDSSEYRLPPPAPSGPRVRPAPPPRLVEQAVPIVAVSSRSEVQLSVTSPESEALERSRSQLSQSEYERRRRSLVRQREESG